MGHLLGIDIGTSGTKTLICDDRGKVLATANAEHPIRSPKPGWSEQHPQDWWKATCAATRAVLAKARRKPADISGIGLSGQMHGSVFLDGKSTRPLRPAILWNDQRTAEQCREIEASVGGRDRVLELAANPALTGFTAPKILWVRRHEPRVFERTRKVLLPKDYIRLLMTGQYATEFSDASGTLLLDVAARTWSRVLMHHLQLDPELMPALCESTQVTGTLTHAAAKQLGLRPGIPVVGGGGDQAAGAVGSGIVSTGRVSATIGTSGVVFAHSDKPLRDPLGRVHTMCHAVPGKFCVFGCMLSAGGSLQWFRNNLGQDEVARARQKRIDPYELLTASARTAQPGGEGLYFLPYLTGERCPYPDPNARGAWIGITTRTTRPMLIRAVLEGITFGMRAALEIIRDMGIPIDEIRASGGGARSTFWRQLQADIYNCPVVITNAAEGPAYGAALLAGVGTGAWKSVHEACAAITVKHRLMPHNQRARAYDIHYGIYRRLYNDLRERFQQMAAIQE